MQICNNDDVITIPADHRNLLRPPASSDAGPNLEPVCSALPLHLGRKSVQELKGSPEDQRAKSAPNQKSPVEPRRQEVFLHLSGAGAKDHRFEQKNHSKKTRLKTRHKLIV